MPYLVHITKASLWNKKVESGHCTLEWHVFAPPEFGPLGHRNAAMEAGQKRSSVVPFIPKKTHQFHRLNRPTCLGEGGLRVLLPSGKMIISRFYLAVPDEGVLRIETEIDNGAEFLNAAGLTSKNAVEEPSHRFVDAKS